MYQYESFLLSLRRCVTPCSIFCRNLLFLLSPQLSRSFLSFSGSLFASHIKLTKWIAAVLKKKLPKPTLRESLLDGVLFCELANALKPNSVRRFHKRPRMLMMKMENIVLLVSSLKCFSYFKAFFLTACSGRFSVPTSALFRFVLCLLLFAPSFPDFLVRLMCMTVV